MKFKPTVPLKRNKKEASSSAIDEALSKPQRSERGGRGGRGGASRGRGRGRGLIIVDTSTASGIFSLGPSAVSRGRPGGFGGGGFASYGGDVPSRAEGENENSDMVEMFTNSIDKDTPVTFRHVSAQDSDIDPVTLEQKMGKIPWMTVKSKKPARTIDTELDKVKSEHNDDMDLDSAESKPTRIEEEEEEEEPVPLPKVYMSSDSPAQNIFALDEKQRLVCVAEEELLFFQLPIVVPKFEKNKEEDVDMIEEKKEEGAATDGLPPAAKKSSLEEAMSGMSLEDMPSGQIGKLVIYKSGKMKMKFGNILLDVNQGLQSTFLENVMVVDHESEETKKAIELGHVVQKFVCVPNMDSLLNLEEEALNNEE
ncbi:RNA polymerase III RPC4-domain-containing protein [Gilbertella persicaria]|uniref:RNA polymerase III RPC4-domain-containing protein n=1 Tax=Gilbertella persicaria TaxID=101096 RepID=UPI00221F5E63|nr:RNA polymerase III RPC4-domain-containing protein [Gilbertella persicaria]KAI8087897.1 RNA polymerase III RPC4-domain-containing protein [Gilbertella persicaria]